MEKTSYEMVNSPKHYNNYSQEVIDMMIKIFGKKETAIFCEMTAFKYRMRMGTKPGNDIEQDLKKEKWYLDKAVELGINEEPAQPKDIKYIPPGCDVPDLKTTKPLHSTKPRYRVW